MKRWWNRLRIENRAGNEPPLPKIDERTEEEIDAEEERDGDEADRKCDRKRDEQKLFFEE
jgi:hypothetical protein